MRPTRGNEGGSVAKVPAAARDEAVAAPPAAGRAQEPLPLSVDPGLPPSAQEVQFPLFPIEVRDLALQPAEGGEDLGHQPESAGVRGLQNVMFRESKHRPDEGVAVGEREVSVGVGKLHGVPRDGDHLNDTCTGDVYVSGISVLYDGLSSYLTAVKMAEQMEPSSFEKLGS